MISACYVPQYAGHDATDPVVFTIVKSEEINMSLRTHHPVGPFSFGHVAHPEVDQMLSPYSTGVVG